MFNEKFCCRCKEDFPVEDSANWQMGAMRELKRLSKKLIGKHFLSDWLNHEDGHYLCGNCYFDLTDELLARIHRFRDDENENYAATRVSLTQAQTYYETEDESENFSESGW